MPRPDLDRTLDSQVRHKGQSSPQPSQMGHSLESPSLCGDELGEIAVTDKTDFALSSGGQLCCLTDLFLLCFADRKSVV